jgi:hypothetical protein
LANEYNGIAYNGKITMFDIDINDNFLNVPSLYNIALPPAYGAGLLFSRFLPGRLSTLLS